MNGPSLQFAQGLRGLLGAVASHSSGLVAHQPWELIKNDLCSLATGLITLYAR